MTTPISPNTQAILLLTAPLIIGKASASSDPLTPGEYKALARHLRSIHRQPADLVTADMDSVLRDCTGLVDSARLQRLLGRGFLLSQALERWGARAIWVISRADPGYPRRLKTRLREDAPAVLYGCGDPHNLEQGGLAVVGSRKLTDSLIDYTTALGRLAAEAGRPVVSGGARGVDQAAMGGALSAGGRVCGVLADSLEQHSMTRAQRDPLLEGRLTLVSPYDPSASFNVGHAMQRNKLIYALADVALVVNADLGKGGTWAGAVEQLEKHRFVPLFVRSAGESSAGLDGLQAKGASPWPTPLDVAALEQVFRESSGYTVSRGQDSLRAVAEAAAPYATQDSHAVEPYAVPAEPASQGARDLLQQGVRAAFSRLLREPLQAAEIAAALEVSLPQTQVWLTWLVDEGVLHHERASAHYVLRTPVSVDGSGPETR